MDVPPDALLTDAEVGAILRKGEATVRRLRGSGELAYLPGRPPLIPGKSLTEYLARRITKKPKPTMRVRLRRK